MGVPEVRAVTPGWGAGACEPRSWERPLGRVGARSAGPWAPAFGAEVLAVPWKPERPQGIGWCGDAACPRPSWVWPVPAAGRTPSLPPSPEPWAGVGGRAGSGPAQPTACWSPAGQPDWRGPGASGAGVWLREGRAVCPGPTGCLSPLPGLPGGSGRGSHGAQAGLSVGPLGVRHVS